MPQGSGQSIYWLWRALNMFDSDPSVVNILLLTCSLFVKKNLKTFNEIPNHWPLEPWMVYWRKNNNIIDSSLASMYINYIWIYLGFLIPTYSRNADTCQHNMQHVKSGNHVNDRINKQHMISVVGGSNPWSKKNSPIGSFPQFSSWIQKKKPLKPAPIVFQPPDPL